METIWRHEKNGLVYEYILFPDAKEYTAQARVLYMDKVIGEAFEKDYSSNLTILVGKAMDQAKETLKKLKDHVNGL